LALQAGSKNLLDPHDLAQGFSQQFALPLAQACDLQIRKQMLATLRAMQTKRQQASARQLLNHAGQNAYLRASAKGQAKYGNGWVFGLSGPLSDGRTGGWHGIQAPQRDIGRERANPGVAATPGL
jgi:hypothetical protein